MKYPKKLTLLTLFSFLFLSAQCQEKKVFAHYMLGIGARQNNSVEGFKQDVKDAMAYGIDGFVLNFAAWEPRYQLNMKNMVQAIDEIDSNFVFFFSFDESIGIPDSTTVKVIKQYYNNKKYYHYHDKFFLSVWAGKETASELNRNILSPLKRDGYKLYFVPFFPANGKEAPSYDDFVENINNEWKGTLNGFFYFGAAGVPFYSKTWPSLLSSGEAAAIACHKNGLSYMACVTPQYWQSKLKNGNRYYDYAGGAGLTAQWKSIIDVQKPEWVELVTWNDWDESTYFSPIENIEKYTKHITHFAPGFFKSHKGFVALNQYFIEWYKTGRQPAIANDKLFYFYRTHPMNAFAPNDAKGEVSKKVGDVKDAIYITTLLTAPADLVVNTGSKVYTYHIKPGISNTEIPFQTGRQVFKLVRNNRAVVSAQGEDIVDRPSLYDFIYYSGVAQ